MRPDEM